MKNTASFKKFSNTYRKELKAGNFPGKDCLNAMTRIVEILDKEAEKFRERNAVQNKKDNLTFKGKETYTLNI